MFYLTLMSIYKIYIYVQYIFSTMLEKFKRKYSIQLHLKINVLLKFSKYS